MSRRDARSPASPATRWPGFRTIGRQAGLRVRRRQLLQRQLQQLVHSCHVVDGDRAAQVVAEVLVDLLAVSFRQDDARQPAAVRGQHLLGDAADRQHLAREGELAAHGRVAAHRTVRVSAPSPGIRVASTKTTSPPPAAMQHSPTTTPGRPVRPATCAPSYFHHALRRNLDRRFVLVVRFVLFVFFVLLVFFMPFFFFVPVVRFAPPAFGPAAHHLGAQRAERARQVPHSRLVGVAPDDGLDRVVADTDLIRCQSVQRKLQRQQVLDSDEALLGVGVAGHLDDLHSFPQHRRHRGEARRRGHEEGLGQVERQVEAVVAEARPRRPVERVEQRRRRAGILQAVDLVEHEHGIADTDVPQLLDDAAGPTGAGAVQRRRAGQTAAVHPRASPPESRRERPRQRLFPAPGVPARQITALAPRGFRRQTARDSTMRALASSSPAWPASSTARACAKSIGASLRRSQRSCSRHSIQSFVGTVSPSDESPNRRRSRAMAACTTGGSESTSPSPNTSRTTVGVITCGPRPPGGPRRTTCRQIAASFAFSSDTPASSV